nr:LacI family DNA-binding transcriptional regulator [Propylenella binzhouense]
MPRASRVTIRDVAFEAGLAVSTVSNALAGKDCVREETRRKVVDIAVRLGYRPSALARSLRSGRSLTMGVLVSDVSNPALVDYVRGVDDVAVREGFTILLGNTDERIEKQVAQMKTLIDHEVDGMVLISQHTEGKEVRELLKIVPYVFIQRRSPHFVDDYVGGDNAASTRKALTYLHELGHRRIGIITGPTASSTAMERLAAYRACVDDLGFDRDEDLVVYGDYDLDAGRRGMHRLWSLPEPPTAILASNDICALGVQDAALELGVSIPDQLSLCGCDDISLAGLRQIDLTTTHMPKRRIGTAAAELLLGKIEQGPNLPPQEIIIPGDLVIRSSCAAPRAKRRRRRAAAAPVAAE